MIFSDCSKKRNKILSFDKKKIFPVDNYYKTNTHKIYQIEFCGRKPDSNRSNGCFGKTLVRKLNQRIFLSPLYFFDALPILLNSIRLFARFCYSNWIVRADIACIYILVHTANGRANESAIQRTNETERNIILYIDENHVHVTDTQIFFAYIYLHWCAINEIVRCYGNNTDTDSLLLTVYDFQLVCVCALSVAVSFNSLCCFMYVFVCNFVYAGALNFTQFSTVFHVCVLSIG